MYNTYNLSIKTSIFILSSSPLKSKPFSSQIYWSTVAEGEERLRKKTLKNPNNLCFGKSTPFEDLKTFQLVFWLVHFFILIPFGANLEIYVKIISKK